MLTVSQESWKNYALEVMTTEEFIVEYIRVTKENLENEHFYCAISNNRDIQVASKKAWLAKRFDGGLVFLKSAE